MKTLNELKTMNKEELQFYISFNISPFIDTKKKKQELINIIVCLQGVKECEDNETN